MGSLSPSMEDCVGQHIPHAQTSVNERSSMVVEIHRSVQGELQDIVPGQSFLGDGSLEVSRVPLFHDVLLLPWIDAA